MMKKIPTSELRIGMVVEKMDRSWLEHPFLTNRKRIESERDLALLIEYSIHEVYINTDVGLDIEPMPVSDRVVIVEDPPPEPPVVEVAPEESVSFTSTMPPLKDPVSVETEMPAARRVRQEAKVVIDTVMHEARVGKNIDAHRVDLVVNGMIDSVFRNRDALASLTRLKGYDEYTFVHSVNVCALCLTLGRQLGLERDSLRVLGIGALLHDIGKMKVPLSVLNKPGKLSDAEFAEMKKHPVYSAEILEQTPGVPEGSKLVALQHHERYHGHGYPHGVTGDDIPLLAQLTSIVDVYDAITSNRCYSNALTPFEGVKKIYEWGKKDFNLPFVERFIQCLGIYPVGTVVLLDSAEIGVVSTVNRERMLRPGVLILFKDEKRRLLSPVPVDLNVQGKDGKFLRTIVRPMDPTHLNIDVDRYLKIG